MPRYRPQGKYNLRPTALLDYMWGSRAMEVRRAALLMGRPPLPYTKIRRFLAELYDEASEALRKGDTSRRVEGFDAFHIALVITGKTSLHDKPDLQEAARLLTQRANKLRDPEWTYKDWHASFTATLRTGDQLYSVSSGIVRPGERFPPWEELMRKYIEQQPPPCRPKRGRPRKQRQ